MRVYHRQRSCPIARTMDLLGDRWTVLIVRDVVLHKRHRFSDLLTSLNGISPRLLSQRLKTMEEQGIIERRLYSTHPPRMEYLATTRGESLRPILMAMHAWGQENEPLHPAEAPAADL